jgi:hypothetical protein
VDDRAEPKLDTLHCVVSGVVGKTIQVERHKSKLGPVHLPHTFKKSPHKPAKLIRQDTPRTIIGKVLLEVPEHGHAIHLNDGAIDHWHRRFGFVALQLQFCYGLKDCQRWDFISSVVAPHVSGHSSASQDGAVVVVLHVLVLQKDHRAPLSFTSAHAHHAKDAREPWM